MRVKVRYFAMLREHKGTSVESIDVQPGTTIARLYEMVFGSTPLSDLPVLFALNESYVDADTKLFDGADVSFLPPLGGG